jgi:hypothetical protein
MAEKGFLYWCHISVRDTSAMLRGTEYMTWHPGSYGPTEGPLLSTLRAAGA